MAAEICKLWSSIVQEDGLAKILLNVASLEDEEEKITSLVSRVFFLLSMSMKTRKDRILNELNELKSELAKVESSSCSTCHYLKQKFIKNPDHKNNISKELISPSKKIKKSSSPLRCKNKAKSPIIYAQETQEVQKFAENIVKVSVPETLDPNDAILMKDLSDEDFDVFDDLSPQISKSKPTGSPIIGKASKGATPLHAIKRKSLTPLLSQSKKSDIGEENMNFHSPSKSCSPLTETPSPSLLGECRLPILPLSDKNKEDTPQKQLPLPVSSTSFGKDKFEAKFIGKSLDKTKSEFIAPNHSRKRFFQESTLSAKDVTYDISFDTKASSHKKLKQTKLSVESFSKKKTIAEFAVKSPKKENKEINAKNDYLLKIGIRMSLNEKNSVPNSKERLNAPDEIQQPIIQSNVSKGNKSKSPTSWFKSPISTKVIKNPPICKSDKQLISSKASHSACNDSTINKSPRRVNKNLSLLFPSTSSDKSPNKSGSLNKTIKKISPKATVTKNLDASQLNEEQVLSELNRDSQEDFELKKINFKKRKIVKSPQKMNDSFDIPSISEEREPQYAYQNDVVRGKNKRQQMPGWSCPDCEAYYRGCSDTQKKRVINACSRHRSKHNVVTNTPEGFWNPDWEDTVNDQDCLDI